MKNNKKQLVIVCRDINLNWDQFINPIFVGVESGIIALLKAKKTINYACGDFDSLTKDELLSIKKILKEKNIETITSPVIKDEIDTEIAIKIAFAKKIAFDQLVIITEGPRWDMILMQFNLMRKYKKYQPILISEKNYAFFANKHKTYTFLKIFQEYNFISFFTLNHKPVTYKLSNCMYYPNQKITIDNKNTLAISNKLIWKNNEEPKLTIFSGTSLVILNKQ